MANNNQDDFLREEAEDLYQNAPCGYISILPDRTIAKINDVLLRWLGYTREELVNKKKFTDIITIGGKIYYETHHDPLQRMQGFVKELNYDLVRKDGTTIPCLLNSTLKKDGNGNILLSRTTIFDITERKKYEKELLRAKREAESAAKAKAQLLSVMSHEIRTPMNAIIGLSHILLDENPRPEQIENLKILKVSAENLLNLLNSILDFSKIEAGKLAVDNTVFSLRELVSGVVNTLKIKASEKGVELLFNFDPNIPPALKSDSVKINQILTNLIGNAIKFTNEGTVSVNVTLKDIKENIAYLFFSIEDTGIGIDKKNISKVFAEFEQGGLDITREFGGTGLGLSITKKLVELLEGNIQVESELGKGSKFSFFLQMQVSNEEVSVDNWYNDHTNSSSLKGINVLLAEDNSVNILVITKFLKKWQLNYDIAQDGEKAFEMIQSKDYDVILMDLQMPKMTGYETTIAVRELKEVKYQKLPIIALTASAVIGENHKIFRIGFNDFVSKPFNPADLYEKILKYSKHKFDIGLFNTTSSSKNKDVKKLINFEKYKSLSDGDSEFLINLTQETIQNFQIYIKDFKNAIEQQNLEFYNKLVHKIKLVTDLLDIKGLEDILKLGAQYIETQQANELENFSANLSKLFESIIVELETELERVPS